MSSRRLRYLSWPRYVWATIWRVAFLAVAGGCLWWCNSYIADSIAEDVLRDIQFLVVAVFASLSLMIAPQRRMPKRLVIPMPPRSQNQTVVRLPVTRPATMSETEWQEWMSGHNGK